MNIDTFPPCHPPSRTARRFPNGTALLALWVATLLGIAPAHAEPADWTVVDDADGALTALAADSLGNIYAVGSVLNASGLRQGIVSKSGVHSPEGETWVDRVFPTSDGREITAFTTGIVTISGRSESVLISAARDVTVSKGKEVIGWHIRRSLDQGATWTTILRSADGAPLAGPNSIALDASGNIYASGFTEVKSRNTATQRPLIRRGQMSANGSYTWKTLVTPFDQTLQAVSCVGSDIFIAGASLNSTSTSPSTWQVRKSTDGGLSWILVDQYQLQVGTGALAAAMTIDRDGNPIVVGWAHVLTPYNGDTMNERYWITRRGSADGTQWSTVDQFALPRTIVDLGNFGDLPRYAGRYAWARGVAVDARNNVYVTGTSVEDVEGQRWITRRFDTTTMEWTTDDNYVVENTSDMQGHKVAGDSMGNVFVAGYWSGSAQRRDWIIRRKLAP
jgi:hypothetical protein